MKELGAANGLNDAFVQEQQRKYIRGEIWRKQDNSRSRGDMMSSDAIHAEAPGRPGMQQTAAYSGVMYVGQ